MIGPDTLIILFASGLSFVMALGLLVRRLQFRNVVLSIILAFMAYLTLYVFFLHTGRIYHYPIFFFSQIPVVILLGPLLYFYVLSLTGDKDRLSVKDTLHFVPLIIIGMYMIPYYLYSPNLQRQIITELLNQRGHLILRGIITGMVFSPVLYIGAPIVRIGLQLRGGNPVQKRMILLFSLLILWLITGIVGIGATIALSYSALRVINVIMSIIILIFYLIAQRYPYLLEYGTVQVKKNSYTRSHLNGIDLDDLDRQLTDIMEQEKIYCDEDLSLPRLSSVLGISSHQLSQFLNSRYSKNFNNFVNTYRIDDARKLLIEDPRRNTLSIAESVGFNSYSAFHSAFRRLAGESPADYRRRHR